MAIGTHHPLVVAAPRRMVRQLPLPAPAPAPAQVTVEQPRSAFWRARKREIELDQLTAERLLDIKSGIGSVSTGVGDVASSLGSLHFPNSLAVTTTMSSHDAHVLGRLTAAVEKVAKTFAEPHACAELSTLSPRAFSLVARLTTLTAHLMDRDDVSASSTLRKLDADRDLIAEARERLIQSRIDALEAFDSAFAACPFDQLANTSDDRSKLVYDELQERAAMLLAIKCLVATTQFDDTTADDWPPHAPPPTAGPDEPPLGGIAKLSPKKSF